MNPHFYEQSIYDKGGKMCNGEKIGCKEIFANDISFEWKEIFANDISDMKLIAKYTNNLLESTSKTKQNKKLDLKMGSKSK